MGTGRSSTDLALNAYEQAANIISHDMSFALYQFGKVNADARSPLADRFDLTHVGAFGHSLGGAAVLQLAHDDLRVQAAFDIDGSPIWKATNGPLGKPVLVLSSEVSMGYGAVLRGARPGLHLKLAGSTHTFSSDILMMPFVSRATAAAAGGSIDPVRALTVTDRYVEAFFDEYLKGKASGLLGGPSRDFPEITFEQGSGRGGAATRADMSPGPPTPPPSRASSRASH